MRKYWNKIDELFHKAHEAYEDEASASSWERINRALDRTDAQRYKKQTLFWKRTAITLTFLLLAFGVYEIISTQHGGKSIALASKEEQQSNKNVDKIEHQPALDNAGMSKSNSDVLPENRPPQELRREKPDQAKTESLHQSPVLFTQATTHSNQLITKRNRQSKIQFTTTGDPNIKPSISGREIDLTTQSTLILAKRTPSAKMISSSQFSKLHAQDSLAGKLSDPQAPEFMASPWTLTAVMANDWGGYRLDNDAPNNGTSNQPPNNEDEAEKINSRERNEFSYSIGVLASRQLNRKWGLKTGLIFSQTSIGIDPQELHAYQTPDGTLAYKYVMSSGYVYVKPGFTNSIAIGDSIQSTEAQHDLSTFVLPIMASRYFTNGKISFIPSVGFTLNYISEARFETELQTMQNHEYVFVTRLEGMKKFYFGLIGDLDIRYKLNAHWSIGMLPSFRYALTPITKNNVVKTFPYSLSLGAAVSYGF